MEAAPENRRRHARVPVPFPLVAFDGDERLGMIEDLSRGGARIRLEEVREDETVREWTGLSGAENRRFAFEERVGREFRLGFRYLSADVGRCRARLVRVLTPGRGMSLGVEFFDPAEASVSRVIEIVERRSSLPT